MHILKHKPLLIIALLFIVLFAPMNLQGQTLFFERQNTFEVYNEEGIEWQNPWAGGINAAQLSKIDLNGDGLEDIFIFDRDGNTIRTFLNVGGNGEAIYEHSWNYHDAFPEMDGWVLLRDYNCDGLKDIFTYSMIGGGMDVYTNTTAAGGNLSFELFETQVNSFYQFSSEYYANLYVSSADIPAIFDFDGDGDLDVLTFTLGGSTLELHLNYSVEEFGNCDSLNFKLRNRCYGQFAEGNETNSITLDAPCNFNVQNPRDLEAGGNRHVGSTITAFDATADGLAEIILGDVSYNNLVILYNHDNPDGATDSIASFDTEFPTTEGSEMPVDIEIFPSGFYEDIDNDGIRDFIASTNNQFTALNDNSMWYYKNSGADNAPDFDFIRKDFLQSEMIEVGKGAYPVIFDVNNDNLPDLLVSNHNYYITGGNAVSRISYFKNVGTENSPAFQLITEDFLGLGEEGYGHGLHPTFADYDGDGDEDMVFGDASGQLFLFINNAAPGEAAEFQAAADPLIRDVDNEIIDVGLYSTPQLFDLNNDGLFDLVIGERNGNINYYVNSGSADNPEFTFMEDTLGGISTVEPSMLVGNSAPHFIRLENETKLFTGTASGKIHRYSAIDGNLDGDFTLENSFAYHFYDGINSKLFLADVNNDPYPELFIGNQGGGIAYLKGLETAPDHVEDKSAFVAIGVYPNPANDILKIDIPKVATGPFEFTIYDIQGKQAANGSLLSTSEIAVQELSAGIYFLKITSETNIFCAKFIKK